MSIVSRIQGGVAVLIAALLPATGALAGPQDTGLAVPGRGVDVHLRDGRVNVKGHEGLCVETVARSGSNTLVVSRTPGAAAVTVRVNGVSRDLGETGRDEARMSGLRLARDGSLFYLRVFKTGDKRTDLVQDGIVRASWPRGTRVRLVGVNENWIRVFEDRPETPVRLIEYARSATGALVQPGRVLTAFSDCLPGGVRPIAGGLLIERFCSGSTGDLVRLDPATGTRRTLFRATGGIRFLPVEKEADLKRRVAAVTVSGTPAALHLFHAVSGLLLSQTGEVRACASDAEGLQSWNQSYRLRALALLWEKTGASVFADLARKSMRLTLAARDGPMRRAGTHRPGCGWSSRIYGNEPGTRLSLMINQAMIATALTTACRRLDGQCPPDLTHAISRTRRCLVSAHDPFFDESAGLYRIRPRVPFRFAGEIAPWNWQMSMAALLADEGREGASDRVRASRIAARFLDEWTFSQDGALWRYWPNARYREKALDRGAMAAQRFEDIGHAGISLQALADIGTYHVPRIQDAIGRRLDRVLDMGPAPPRDLDGAGPRSSRWFPSSGWARFATPRLSRAYAARVPGSLSADTIHAFATLYDPRAVFELTVDIHACALACARVRRLTYTRVEDFLQDNPFFTVGRHTDD